MSVELNIIRWNPLAITSKGNEKSFPNVEQDMITKDGGITISGSELNGILGQERCLINIDTRGILKNSNQSSWAGYQIDQIRLMKKPIWTLITECQIKQEKIRINWHKWLLLGGKPIRFWLENGMKHRENIPIEIRMIPHSNSQFNGSSFWIVLTDLSFEWANREKWRAKIRSAKRNKEQAYLDFAAWLHDWKAPLSTIESSTWLCLRYKDELDNEKRNRHLRRVEKSVHEMKTGMQDWQTWHQPPSFRKIEKTHAWKLIKERIQQISPVLKPGQNIFLFHQGTSEINTDPLALSHVLDNLLSNASKYSPDHTSIWVRAWNAKGILRIDVSDEGIGIPNNELNRLFEPKFRGSNASDTPGNGLGLSTVHRLVKQLGGDIQVKSKVNEGSTFSITIKNQQTHEKSTDHRRQSRNPVQHFRDSGTGAISDTNR